MDPKLEAAYTRLKQIRNRTDLTLKPTPLLKQTFTDFDGSEVPFKLRYYQIQGILHLVAMNRFLLGDDTGLGKTAMTIAGLCYAWAREPDLKAIILTNKSVVGQWALEFEKFCTPGEITVLECAGTPSKRQKIYKEFEQSTGATVLVMGYATARRDIKFIQEWEGFVLVADECTAFKNPGTQTYQVVQHLSSRSARFWGLTATLIKNNLIEGFGIYSLVVPGLFPATKNKFMGEYCITRMQQIPGSRRKIPVIIGYRKEHIDKFREKIDPYFLARAKFDVAKELPVLTIREHKCGMSRDQERTYKEALAGLFEKGTGEEVETTKLTALIYCQQIVDHPGLVDVEGDSAKMDELFELLTEGDLEGEKIIVFSRFRKMVDKLEEVAHSKKYKLKTVRITGSENEEQRKAAMKAFQDPASDVQICWITMAAAEGINLQAAKALIFYDSPWSAGDYLQCLDDETEVLTWRGFVGRTEIRKNDKVAAMDPCTSQIQWQRVRSITDRLLAKGERMYEVNSRHLNLRVTGGHRMLYRRKTLKDKKAVWPREWKLETAEEMASEKTHYQIPACGDQEAEGVPLTEDQLEFIGWFLSDGSLNRANGQLVVTQATHQPQIHDLRRCIQQCGFDWSEYDRDPQTYDAFPNGKPQIAFSIPKGTQRGSRARNGWKDLEPYLDKDFPVLLEKATAPQLAAVLRGLHLGDGGKWRNQSWTQRSYHIFTGRKVFADRLQSLCVRRGFRCNVAMRKGNPEKNRKEGFTLHIKKAPAWSLCGNMKHGNRSHMTLSETKKSERVWCVENDLGTLVVRRHGKIAVVGNCLGRMIRIGSTHDRCYAIHMVARGTIDVQVMAVLRKKMKLIEQVMGKRLKGEGMDDIIVSDDNSIDDVFSALRAQAKGYA